MNSAFYSIALTEFRTIARNKWVILSVLIMVAFNGLITFAGTAPAGSLGADPFSTTAATLATLTVYLVPLIALLVSYDSLAGESSRGTLALLFTYPVSRATILLGKTTAQFAVLAIAVGAGLVVAALGILVSAGGDTTGIDHLIRLLWTSLLLGAAFLAIGNAVSASSREPGTAAGVVIAIWVAMVVMYDVALLAALVADAGGWFTTYLFNWLLVISPTDAFRLFNLAQIEAATVSGGLATASQTAGITNYLPLISMMIWPLVGLLAATFQLNRTQS
jgi:Cu-processing system permease protein